MAGKKKWSELSSVADMSQEQWQHFKEALERHLAANPLATVVDSLVDGENRPRRKDLTEDLNSLRSAKNRPRQGKMPQVNKRLQRLLKLLEISDPPDNLFKDRVYLSLDKDTVKYVGSGNDERVERFSGLRIPTFQPLHGLHVSCLEGIALWLCRVGWHSVESSKRAPSVCNECHGTAIEKLVPSIDKEFGKRWSSDRILKALGEIGKLEYRQL